MSLDALTAEEFTPRIRLSRDSSWRSSSMSHPERILRITTLMTSKTSTSPNSTLSRTIAFPAPFTLEWSELDQSREVTERSDTPPRSEVPRTLSSEPMDSPCPPPTSWRPCKDRPPETRTEHTYHSNLTVIDIECKACQEILVFRDGNPAP